MKMAPKIGIVKCSNYKYYEYAIKRHGGTVKKLSIYADYFETDYEGLLLPGGGDIDPELYGEEQHPKTKYVNRQRDEFEISLFNHAIENDIPVLGICRGVQIINVALGGSLYQDIGELYPKPAEWHEKDSDHKDSWQDIEIISDCKLIEIVGKATDIANSAHHQAIKNIGEGLVVTARSIEDGIIEAMEYPAKPFVVAVQYHPERMGKDRKIPYHDGEFLEHATRLFDAFIGAASDRKKIGNWIVNQSNI